MIEFIIKDPPIISVNAMYFHYPVRGKIRSIKSDPLKALQKYYEKELKEDISDDDVQLLKTFLEEDKKNNGLMITLEFGLPRKNMRRCDVSNYVKAIEDCIVKRTGIDDKHHLKVVAYKSISPDNELKYIRIKLEPYTLGEFKE